jgi:hypothetical protein
VIITESLAKGLTHRFLSEAQDIVSKSLRKLEKEAGGYKNSKSGWEKYVGKARSILQNVAISFYEGGSKTSPYFAFVGLSVDKEREFNSWNEMCLSGEAVIQSHHPRFIDTSGACFNVGEHAISRIYERSKLRMIDEFTVDIYSILPEFQQLPLWSAFWIGNLAVITDNFSKHFFPHFYHPVIPAKSGIFLCELTHVKFPKVEVRTFVDDKNLSEEQLKLKKILWDIGIIYKSSPLATFPITNSVESDYYVNIAVLGELAEYAELITNALFQNNSSPQFAARAQEDFLNLIKNAQTERSAKLSQAYRKIGIRETQLVIKKEKLRMSMNTIKI